MKNITVKKLKNGLTVLIVPRKESLTTTVGILVAAGSKYEDKKTNGLSHFLEHMCFKGTKKRPYPIDISAELDAMGAQYNAFTGHEYTSYYAKVQNKSFPKAFEIISDLYLNPVFREEDINVERGVIIEEINMYEDFPNRKVENIFMSLLYGDQPAGRPILGPKKNVRSFTRKDFISYREKNYLPKHTVVLVSGNVKVADVMKLANTHFKNISSGKKMAKKKTKEGQKKPQFNADFKKLEQTHLVLGVRAFGIQDKRKVALQVLSEILGGGMSSRLFKKIRDELGAAYYVRSGTDFFTDHGFLSVSAGVDNKKTRAVIEAILEEMRDLKTNKVSKEELNKAKEHLLGTIFMSAETSDSLGYFYGFQEILGMKPISPGELAKHVKGVTADDVLRVARVVFKDSRLNLALIGPFKTKNFSAILHV